MIYARVAFRAVALLAVTLAFFALRIAGIILAAISRNARFGCRSFVFRHWARAAAALLGVKINARGRAPRGAFFLVVNHLSYLDIVILSALADCAFIAKSEVARWPVIGLLCQSMNTIFIDRAKRRDTARVNQMVEQALAAGQGVVLFAEGTSTQGATVLPFKSALLEQAARAGFPVSHAALSYSAAAGEPPAHLSVCWWGDMTFLKHLFGLFRLSEIRASVVFGSQPIRETNRKTLANKLHSAIIEDFVPVVRLEESQALMR
jgi:lyso-ornithine lipid O-acyltransferase